LIQRTLLLLLLLPLVAINQFLLQVHLVQLIQRTLLFPLSLVAINQFLLFPIPFLLQKVLFTHWELKCLD
jgi:hypothetical protein